MSFNVVIVCCRYFTLVSNFHKWQFVSCNIAIFLRCCICQPALKILHLLMSCIYWKILLPAFMLECRCSVRPLMWHFKLQPYKINYDVYEIGVNTYYFKLVCSVALWSAILFWWCQQFHTVSLFVCVVSTRIFLKLCRKILAGSPMFCRMVTDCIV